MFIMDDGMEYIGYTNPILDASGYISFSSLVLWELGLWVISLLRRVWISLHDTKHPSLRHIITTISQPLFHLLAYNIVTKDITEIAKLYQALLGSRMGIFVGGFEGVGLESIVR